LGWFEDGEEVEGNSPWIGTGWQGWEKRSKRDRGLRRETFKCLSIGFRRETLSCIVNVQEHPTCFLY
jgi:hypothetical protein